MRTLQSLRDTITDKDTVINIPVVVARTTSTFTASADTTIFSNTTLIQKGFYVVSYQIRAAYNTTKIVSFTNIPTILAPNALTNRIYFSYTNNGITIKENITLTNSFIINSNNNYTWSDTSVIYIPNDELNFTIGFQAVQHRGNPNTSPQLEGGVNNVPPVRIIAANSYFKLTRLF